MSGIVSSLLNHHGSGIISNVGTDGQIFTSTGAGLAQGFEAAAGGGKILQMLGSSDETAHSVTTTDVATTLSVAITPTSASSKIYVSFNFSDTVYDSDQNNAGGGFEVWRSIDGASFAAIAGAGNAAAMTHGFNCSSTDSSGFILSYDRVNLEYWDTTHNTTTEIIYKLYIGRPDATDNYYYIGSGSQNRTVFVQEIDQS